MIILTENLNSFKMIFSLRVFSFYFIKMVHHTTREVQNRIHYEIENILCIKIHSFITFNIPSVVNLSETMVDLFQQSTFYILLLL